MSRWWHRDEKLNYFKLKDIATIYNGNSINKTEKKQKYMNDVQGWNYIATKDVGFDGKIMYKNGVIIPYSEAKFKIAPAETVLVCSEGGSAGKKTAITTEDVCFGNKLFAIVNDKEKFNSKYIYYYTRYGEFVKQFKLLATSLMGGISLKNFGMIKVPLPPLDEQQYIVEYLEKWFSELDKSEETLQTIKKQLEIYRQAVLKEAFSSLNEKVQIRNISSMVTSGSRGWAKYYNEEGVRFIRITDLTRNHIKLKNDAIQRVRLPENAEGKRSRLQGGDVLISITADLGSIALIPDSIEESYVNQHIAVVRFNNIRQGEFMAWYLKSEYGQKDLLKNKRGGGKLGLGLDDIRNTVVPVVSNEIADRIVKEIDSRLSVCDSIEQTVDTVLSQAEALRQGILKKAFEGGLSE